MNGLREAMEYVTDLDKANVLEIGGREYTDRPIYPVKKELLAAALHMSTLSGLVDYIKANIDVMADKMIVHVVSPTEVRLLSSLNADRERECLVDVEAELPTFQFGKYLGAEDFLINIRSKFIQNDGAVALLRFAGTTEAGTVAAYADDGISQSATVKRGIAGKETELVPNPVKLRPYRTFTEVQQPESEFIFRMKNFDNEAGCALFEADGGAWKREAMQNIKKPLEFELSELAQFTVIS